jgi:hypothetical protein
VSLLAWIDYDEAERQRAQRIMALFQERETRDELGLGSIRDSIADHLFPGTSTIQTRLRYMLFIPWIFQMMEGSTNSPERLAAEARGLENRLVDALRAGGENTGVIGREAGANLQRLPSSVYWVGLGAWGIRIFPGSIDSFFSSMRHLTGAPSRLPDTDAGEPNTGARLLWSATLPPRPNDFLEATTFNLSLNEAGFITDRLVSRQPKSLLASLARKSSPPVDCRYI